MNRTVLRYAIIVLTLITAVIHLYLGAGSLSDPEMSPLNILWLLNGLGYLGLLGGLFLSIPFLVGRKIWVLYAFMLFAAVTIIAWIFFSGPDMGGILGYATKVDEVLLIAALFLYERAAPEMPQAAVAAKTAAKPAPQTKASSTTTKPASGKSTTGTSKKKPANKTTSRSRTRGK